MTSKQATAGMAVRTGLKAGGMNFNHSKSQAGLAVRTGLRAGLALPAVKSNHSKTQAGRHA